LIDVEIAHVLRRRAALGEIDSEHGHILLDALSAFPVQRYPHFHLLARMWELRHNFTAYDAAYVSLAEALNTALLTRDGRLANAAAPFVSVELV
jgi:predicted nucleic acid-binding protein